MPDHNNNFEDPLVSNIRKWLRQVQAKNSHGYTRTSILEFRREPKENYWGVPVATKVSFKVGNEATIRFSPLAKYACAPLPFTMFVGTS